MQPHEKPLKEPVLEAFWTVDQVDFPQITESLGSIEFTLPGSGFRA